MRESGLLNSKAGRFPEFGVWKKEKEFSIVAAKLACFHNSFEERSRTDKFQRDTLFDNNIEIRYMVLIRVTLPCMKTE